MDNFPSLLIPGAYSSWFASQPASESSALLMSVLTYVASALTDPALCLQAANALRNLCDANRKVLAPQIGAFAQLHAALGGIPVRLGSFEVFARGTENSVVSLFRTRKRGRLFSRLRV